MTISEQIFTVAVYDGDGNRVYLRREDAYSAMGAMVQITQRHSYREPDGPEPFAVWTDDARYGGVSAEGQAAEGQARLAGMAEPPESLAPAKGLPVSRELAWRIAEDAVGLFLEYRDSHGHDEASARASAVAEVAEGASVDILTVPGADELLAAGQEVRTEVCVSGPGAIECTRGDCPVHGTARARGEYA